MVIYRHINKVYEHVYTQYQKKGQTMLSVKKKKSYIKGKRFSRRNPILDRLLGKVSLIM